MADSRKWMPRLLDNAIKDELWALYPDDPHRAAAEAWEQYEATQEPTDQVVSASSGDQSVTYGALSGIGKKIAFHRSRQRPLSVPVGPDHLVGRDYLDSERSERYEAQDGSVDLYDDEPL